MKYTDCAHDWEVCYRGKGSFRVCCKVCHLSVEGYQDHISLWDYTRRVGGRIVGMFDIPDPEDEEETKLEPEEVIVDAEGGKE